MFKYYANSHTVFDKMDEEKDEHFEFGLCVYLRLFPTFLRYLQKSISQRNWTQREKNSFTRLRSNHQITFQFRFTRNLVSKQWISHRINCLKHGRPSSKRIQNRKKRKQRDNPQRHFGFKAALNHYSHRWKSIHLRQRFKVRDIDTNWKRLKSQRFAAKWDNMFKFKDQNSLFQKQILLWEQNLQIMFKKPFENKSFVREHLRKIYETWD